MPLTQKSRPEQAEHDAHEHQHRGNADGSPDDKRFGWGHDWLLLTPG